MAVARRPLLRKTLLHVGLVPFLLFALFPFYHMTLTSLKQDRELYDRHAVPLIIRQGPTEREAADVREDGRAHLLRRCGPALGNLSLIHI